MSNPTTARAYTITEIDRMRQAINWGIIPAGQPYYAAEKNAQVEDRLRTYMMAGLSVEDVEKQYGGGGSLLGTSA